jgi:hypothetical protein
MLDMEAIVRRQDQERCASITSMIRHYVARRAQVTEGHPHNAELSVAWVHAYAPDGMLIHRAIILSLFRNNGAVVVLYRFRTGGKLYRFGAARSRLALHGSPQVDRQFCVWEPS